MAWTLWKRPGSLRRRAIRASAVLLALCCAWSLAPLRTAHAEPSIEAAKAIEAGGADIGAASFLGSLPRELPDDFPPNALVFDDQSGLVFLVLRFESEVDLNRDDDELFWPELRLELLPDLLPPAFNRIGSDVLFFSPGPQRSLTETFLTGSGDREVEVLSIPCVQWGFLDPRLGFIDSRPGIERVVLSRRLNNTTPSRVGVGPFQVDVDLSESLGMGECPPDAGTISVFLAKNLAKIEPGEPQKVSLYIPSIRVDFAGGDLFFGDVKFTTEGSGDTTEIELQEAVKIPSAERPIVQAATLFTEFGLLDGAILRVHQTNFATHPSSVEQGRGMLAQCYKLIDQEPSLRFREFHNSPSVGSIGPGLTEAPTVEITSPAPGAEFVEGQGLVTVTGTVTDLSCTVENVTIKVDGTEMGEAEIKFLECMDKDACPFMFNGEIVLERPTNGKKFAPEFTIEVTAEPRENFREELTGRAQVSVIALPTVMITSPVENVPLPVGNVTVSGTFNDPARTPGTQVTIVVNDETEFDAEIDGNAFTVDIPIPLGENKITATVRAAGTMDGRLGVDEIFVTRDDEGIFVTREPGGGEVPAITFTVKSFTQRFGEQPVPVISGDLTIAGRLDRNLLGRRVPVVWVIENDLPCEDTSDPEDRTCISLSVDGEDGSFSSGTASSLPVLVGPGRNRIRVVATSGGEPSEESANIIAVAIYEPDPDGVDAAIEGIGGDSEVTVIIPEAPVVTITDVTIDPSGSDPDIMVSPFELDEVTFPCGPGQEPEDSIRVTTMTFLPFGFTVSFEGTVFPLRSVFPELEDQLNFRLRVADCVDDCREGRVGLQTSTGRISSFVDNLRDGVNDIEIEARTMDGSATGCVALRITADLGGD